MSSESGGFPDIGALAPLGDGLSAALVGPDGAIEFFCPLRFDAPALVFPLLDRRRGGTLRFGPVDSGQRLSCSRRYGTASAVLNLEWAGSDGRARMQMAMRWPAPDSGQEILWLLEGLEGSLEVEAIMDLRPGFGVDPVNLTVNPSGAYLQHPEAPTGFEIDGLTLHQEGQHAHGRGVLKSGDRWAARLRVDLPSSAPADAGSVTADDGAASLTATEEAWQEWAGHLVYDGPGAEAVLRSAITLEQLIYAPTGAVTAAVTTSLPEQIGSERNWDYRYTWLRDASFTLNALYQLQCRPEANAYASWLCRTTAASGLPLGVLYRVDGTAEIPEASLTELSGYRNSQPVRVGNAAETQLQLDSYGELLDCLTICETFGDDVMRTEWPNFRRLVDFAAGHWDEPDSGIWEVRSRPRHFVHSKALAWTALDRGARLAEMHDLPGNVSIWRKAAEECRAQVFEQGIADGHFIRAYDDPSMDASLLMLPIVGFVDGDDPVMLATLDAVQAQLGPEGAVVPGLLHRYDLTHPEGGGRRVGRNRGSFHHSQLLAGRSPRLGRSHQAGRRTFHRHARLGRGAGNLR